MSFQEVKICLLGDSGVGKSSIAQRFVHNTFTTRNESTIGASFMSKLFVVNNTTYKLNIWDTAGQERYKSLAPLYYRGAAACIVVYDVTSLASFTAVQSWVKVLQSHVPAKVVLALAGNKSDLTDKREVSAKDAKAFADSIGAIFMETSARNSGNVSQLFFSIVSRLPDSGGMSSSKSRVNLNNVSQTSNKENQQRCCGSSSKNSV